MPPVPVEGSVKGRSQVLRAGAAAALLACAVVLALAGIDVLRWRLIDARARVGLAIGSHDRRIFEPATLLPVGVSRWLVAAGDDVEFGQALQRWSVVKFQAFKGPAAQADVGRAELALERLSSSHALSKRARGDAISLHAILLFEELGAQASTNNVQTAIDRGAEEFRRAIRVDPSNPYAKYDLEVMLRAPPPGSLFSPRPGTPPLKGSSKGVRGGAGAGGTISSGGGF
jgi:hypothetical protein